MAYNSTYTGAEVDALLGKAGTALQAHQPLKTINGESVAGEGDIAAARLHDLTPLAGKASGGYAEITEEEYEAARAACDAGALFTVPEGAARPSPSPSRSPANG